MTTIYGLRQLPRQTDTYVYVIRVNQMYIRVDDEYLPKPYLSRNDISAITGWTKTRVSKVCQKLKMPIRAEKYRLSVDEFFKIYTP